MGHAGAVVVVEINANGAAILEQVDEGKLKIYVALFAMTLELALAVAGSKPVWPASYIVFFPRR